LAGGVWIRRDSYLNVHQILLGSENANLTAMLARLA
jgi:hypothetical protein